MEDMADNREFDLVLFGGRVSSANSPRVPLGAAPEAARIGLAGRSLDKLTAVATNWPRRRELGLL